MLVAHAYVKNKNDRCRVDKRYTPNCSGWSKYSLQRHSKKLSESFETADNLTYEKDTMAVVFSSSEDTPKFVASYEPMPFDLIIDDSGDIDFAALAGTAWGLDDSDENSAGSISDSSPACDELLAPPESQPRMNSTEQLSPTSATSSSSTKTARPPRRRVPQSQRVKAEKAFLTQQIAALQKQLADAMVKNAIANCNTQPSAWRATAKRQLARRTLVEKENERLRAKLTHQLQVAKSLQVVMANRSTEFFEQLEPRPCPPVWPIHGVLDGDLDQVFRQFAVDIQKAYEAIDLVLPSPEDDSQVPVNDRPESKSTIKSHHQGSTEQLYVELRHSYTVPFTLDEVKYALPKVACSEFFRQNREIERYDLGENVYAGKFLIRPEDSVTNFGNEETVTSISRMYFESDRVIKIWRAFSAARNDNFAQALSISTGWTVFRAHPDVENHVVVHVCARNVPLRSEIIPKTRKSLTRLPESAPEVGAFTTQVLCTTADIVPSITDSMENLLLEEAAGHESIRV